MKEWPGVVAIVGLKLESINEYLCTSRPRNGLERKRKQRSCASQAENLSLPWMTGLSLSNAPPIAGKQRRQGPLPLRLGQCPPPESYVHTASSAN